MDAAGQGWGLVLEGSGEHLGESGDLIDGLVNGEASEDPEGHFASLLLIPPNTDQALIPSYRLVVRDRPHLKESQVRVP